MDFLFDSVDKYIIDNVEGFKTFNVELQSTNNNNKKQETVNKNKNMKKIDINK